VQKVGTKVHYFSHREAIKEFGAQHFAKAEKGCNAASLAAYSRPECAAMLQKAAPESAMHTYSAAKTIACPLSLGLIVRLNVNMSLPERKKVKTATVGRV
jgi:hypothetical protein